MIDAKTLATRFLDHFSGTPRVYWAPGRVNLIGDHIDYCGGVVLPMPIQYGTTIGVAAADDDRLHAVSVNAPAEPIDVPRANAQPFPTGSWGRFVEGVHALLAEAGTRVGGANVVVEGDIPGSGLSSSASLTVGLLFALGEHAHRPLPALPLALAAQRVEHEFVGVQCGLMDQAAVTFSEPGSALLFDCHDHTFESIRVDQSIDVLVVDTGVARKLVDSQYNARLDETRRAARALGVAHDTLARVGEARLRAQQSAIRDPIVFKRARHVVSEAARVRDAAAALRARDWTRFGRALNESHRSLRDDYEVTSVELDVLSDALRIQRGCHGARMTGAGFGGNVVAIFESGTAEAAMPQVSATYRSRFGIEPSWFLARSLGGVRRIDE